MSSAEWSPPGVAATFQAIPLSPSGDTTGATDTARIAAALASGNNVSLGAGRFTTNAALVLATNYQRLQGASRGLTGIFNVAGGDAVVQATALANQINDLTLDGGGLTVHELDCTHAETSVRHMLERIRCNGNQAAPVNNTAGDGHITATQTAFTSASGVFTANDVGKWIIVVGAGAAGVNLVAQISAFVSATAVTLSVAAGTTVTTSNYQYWGVSYNVVGCEDSVLYKCERTGSEASPSTLTPAAMISTPSGMVNFAESDLFGPVFYNALNLNGRGCNLGPMVAVNGGGSTAYVLDLEGCWIYDGGTPTLYSPIDVCAGFLPAQVITRGVHMIAASQASWVNGQMVSGGVVELGAGNVYIQGSTNANATMTVINQTAGSTNTRTVCEGGRINTQGSAATVNYRAGGSSSHVNVQRGKLTWGGGNVTATTTQPTAPGVPSSGSALTNPFGCSCLVYVQHNGATISAISVDGTSISASPPTTDPIPVWVRAMSSITLTYSVATPTWVWQPAV